MTLRIKTLNLMALETVLIGRVLFMHISFILSVTNKLFMLSVVMLNVIMLVQINR
jgi:hypothetical protein